MEDLVKAMCYWSDSVLYFHFCSRGKCIRNDDGHGGKKEEMLNWRKNISEMLPFGFGIIW